MTILEPVIDDDDEATCHDCGVDTLPGWPPGRAEYYMVHDHVWLEAGMPKIDADADEDGGILCIGCLETRLGRRLTPADFTDARINDPSRDEPGYAWAYRSPRLLARLTGTPQEGSSMTTPEPVTDHPLGPFVYPRAEWAVTLWDPDLPGLEGTTATVTRTPDWVHLRDPNGRDAGLPIDLVPGVIDALIQAISEPATRVVTEPTQPEEEDAA